MSDQPSAACSHLRVTYAPRSVAGSGLRDWWECRDCGARFVPMSHAEFHLAHTVLEFQILLRDALQLKGGWREAIVMLEDFCSEPVRLKNMVAAADQLDGWAKEAQALLDKTLPAAEEKKQ